MEGKPRTNGGLGEKTTWAGLAALSFRVFKILVSFFTSYASISVLITWPNRTYLTQFDKEVCQYLGNA